jgi:hypothetical protein
MIALLIYFVPVALVSILFIVVSTAYEFDLTFIGLVWVAIVILPLVTTVGVFIAYRGTYATRPIGSTGLARQRSEEEQQWDQVLNKALDWNRFLMPLSILNMFITLVGGFFCTLILPYRVTLISALIRCRWCI